MWVQRGQPVHKETSALLEPLAHRAVSGQLVLQVLRDRQVLRVPPERLDLQVLLVM